MRVALVHCVSTQWQAEGRMLGRVELPPPKGAVSEIEEWVGPLRAAGVAKLLHAPDELATDTAKRLAQRLGVPRRSARELAEVNIGLWAGLTEEQFENRYETVHRELCEDPLNVQAPEGESFGEATKRLTGFLRKQLARKDLPAIGLVLRPLVFALTRCLLEKRDFCEILSVARESGAPLVIEQASLPDAAAIEQVRRRGG